MAEKQRLQISVRDKIQIYEFLKSVCEKKAGDICTYKAGWSDKLVYDHFVVIMPRLSMRHVENVRAENFGILEVDKAASTRPFNVGQFERLHSMVEVHSKSMSSLAIALTRRIETLEQELGRVSSRLERAILELGGLPGERPCDEQHD